MKAQIQSLFITLVCLQSHAISQHTSTTGVSKVDILETVEQRLAVIQESLAAGETVFIRGFGTFAPWKRAAKSGRNIKKGIPVQILGHHIPYFKPGSEFRQILKRPAGTHLSTSNISPMPR